MLETEGADGRTVAGFRRGALLDKLGLTKKDSAGMRLLPNGKPATIEISVVPAFGA